MQPPYGRLEGSGCSVVTPHRVTLRVGAITDAKLFTLKVSNTKFGTGDRSISCIHGCICVLRSYLPKSVMIRLIKFPSLILLLLLFNSC